ncbi:rhamnan synthesis F family protein, partial [Ectopseudomonas guguanensis]|uniref:rhamnan synthesis F family protein n=1 Tax=Ectopseudomonas guguanensis TaxID=1198456 RepID=UPI00285B6DAE
CKFVWVGDGFDPDNDLAFSIYLNREIEFAGLGDDFIFLEHQKNLDTIFSITDVFCLASRMDPFPNVVIDALSHDLHVACFDHGSGSAEFLKRHKANASVVDFVDTYEMANSITQYLNQKDKKEGVNLKILKEHLDFDKYVNYLDKLIDQSVAFKAHAQKITNELLKSGHFDAEFCGGEGDAEEKCRRYVEYGLKGIHFYNPKIGFSEIDWLSKHSPNNPYIVPLYEAIKQENIETHPVITLPTQTIHKPKIKYAVHLHLYYIDMADYFARYFANLAKGYDLYITVVKKESIAKVKDAFNACGASHIEIVAVENIGRDIGPLIFSLKQQILDKGYEVIGHFHSKKSLDLESGGGDKWLNYLMDILIGDQTNAQDVLNIFQQDDKVGLVFPEDRNTTDMGENKAFVAELCSHLSLPVPTQTPIFPMGNMFWARVRAIKELFSLDADTVLQPEPLPYDGSYMHAIERITPLLTEKNGYKYTTIYKKGMAWK